MPIMPKFSNHYDLLGVSQDASSEDIKGAYKDLVRIFHPDSNYYADIVKGGAGERLTPQSDEMFKLIVSAYEVLIDIERRALYDETLPKGLRDWDEGHSDREKHIERVRAAVIANAFGKGKSLEEAPGATSKTQMVRQARKSEAMAELIRARKGFWGQIMGMFS